jgi:hypothetical protein
MFCPNCRSEYGEGIFQCSDCNVDLVPELPPEDTAEYVDLVDLETYPDRTEAELAKGLLASGGIDGVIYGDEYGGYAPALSFSEGVRLMVKRADLVKARMVLDEALEEEEHL